jgi:hypothetical protein
MNTARQVVRWTIPGAVFFLMLGIFQLATSFLDGRSLAFLVRGGLLQEIQVVDALLLVVAGLPVGFLIYQIYHLQYGSIARPGHIVSRDRGAEVLSSLPDDAVRQLVERAGLLWAVAEQPLEVRRCLLGNESGFGTYDPTRQMASRQLRSLVLRLEPKSLRTKAGRKAYRFRQRTNWHLVLLLMDIASMERGFTQIRDEYTGTSDIFHSLGATRAAVLMAYTVYVPYRLLFHAGLTMPQLLVSIAAVTMLTGALVAALWMTRHKAWLSAESGLKFALHWYVTRAAPPTGHPTLPESVTTA